MAQIVFYWPDSNNINKALLSINMSGSPVWNSGSAFSPTTVTSSQWLPGTDLMRQVAPNSTGIMQFYFDKNADPSPYNITVTFDNTCTRNANR